MGRGTAPSGGKWKEDWSWLSDTVVELLVSFAPRSSLQQSYKTKILSGSLAVLCHLVTHQVFIVANCFVLSLFSAEATSIVSFNHIMTLVWERFKYTQKTLKVHMKCNFKPLLCLNHYCVISHLLFFDDKNLNGQGRILIPFHMPFRNPKMLSMLILMLKASS